MRLCPLYPIFYFSEDSGIRTPDGEFVGHALSSGKKDKKKQAAQVAIEKHLMECKATDLQNLGLLLRPVPNSS